MPTLNGLPYPASSAVPDVPGDILALVTAVDSQLVTGRVNARATAPTELVTVSATAATGTVQFDAKTQGVVFYTSNAAGNFTLNLRGNSTTTLNSVLAVGQSFTANFLVTNGATPYYMTAVTVDGAAQTVRWQGGTPPSGGNASSVDAYAVTVVKTAASTYSAFGSQTRFA
jgi:hypothetical protein